MDDAVEVTQGRPAECEVLDAAGHPGDADHVALAVLVLDQDQSPVEVILDQALRPEPHGDPDHPETRHRRADVKPKLAQHHQPRDHRDEPLEGSAAEHVEGVHPLPELDRAQFLGRSLRRLPIEQRLDHAVDEDPGEPRGEDGRHDDEQDGRDIARHDLDDRGPRLLVEFRHGASLAPDGPWHEARSAVQAAAPFRRQHHRVGRRWPPPPREPGRRVPAGVSASRGRPGPTRPRLRSPCRGHRGPVRRRH